MIRSGRTGTQLASHLPTTPFLWNLQREPHFNAFLNAARPGRIYFLEPRVRDHAGPKVRDTNKPSK
jgi:hypothetical protein